jgi:hypothetical protein
MYNEDGDDQSVCPANPISEGCPTPVPAGDLPHRLLGMEMLAAIGLSRRRA